MRSRGQREGRRHVRSRGERRGLRNISTRLEVRGQKEEKAKDREERGGDPGTFRLEIRLACEMLGILAQLLTPARRKG